jgi:hypothetical protein
VYSHLTTIADGAVYPVGDPRAFLKVAELVTRFVVSDISMTLQAHMHACSIASLLRLSQKLTAFNQGSRMNYPSYPMAVGMVRQELEAVADNLASSCGGY